jgi:hypothetical protein
MSENKSKNMPHFASLDDLVEFFDTHDLGEYCDGMPEAHFEVDIQMNNGKTPTPETSLVSRQY